MSETPVPTPEQIRLLRKCTLPGRPGQLFERFDVKRLLRDPGFVTLRRYIMARGLVVAQAREDIGVSFDQAYRLQH